MGHGAPRKRAQNAPISKQFSDPPVSLQASAEHRSGIGQASVKMRRLASSFPISRVSVGHRADGAWGAEKKGPTMRFFGSCWWILVDFCGFALVFGCFLSVFEILVDFWLILGGFGSVFGMHGAPKKGPKCAD